MHFFTSPHSTISSIQSDSHHHHDLRHHIHLPSMHPHASVAMSRSDSRDSNMCLSSASSAMDIRPCSSSSTSNYHIAHHRNSSTSSNSSGWSAAPYRSCHRSSAVASEATSFLSDDDLLLPSDLDLNDYEVPAPKQLSTEEQIEMLRQQAEKTLHLDSHRAQAWWTHDEPQVFRKERVVRFAGEEQMTRSKPRRPSAAKRRVSHERRRVFNGPC